MDKQMNNDSYTFVSVSGTYPNQHFYERRKNSHYNDNLWEQMYVRPKPVIIVCGYCNSHNVIDNATCVRCGAPMGYGFEIK